MARGGVPITPKRFRLLIHYGDTVGLICRQCFYVNVNKLLLKVSKFLTVWQDYTDTHTAYCLDVEIETC